MSTTVEVSNDQSDWQIYERGRTRIEEYQWVRTIETVNKAWSRVQIEQWLREKFKNTGTHIEYSMDDGFSYQILRVNPRGAPEDAARIYTIVNNARYSVRSITQSENTSYITPMTSITSIMNQNNPTTPAVKTKTELRWVRFEDDKYLIFKHSPGNDVASRIEHTIPMSLSVPNTNTVILGTGSRNNPADMGHVYWLEPCTTLTFNWQNVITAHRKSRPDPRELVWVESARTYDNETMRLGGNIFAMSVLSDKYYVDSTGQYAKIGSRWLIHITHVDDFVNNINNAGGFAYYSHVAKPEEPKRNLDLLESIMSVKTELKAAIEARDSTILTKVFFEACEFRDKAVDELKELNVVIGKARELAMELISEDSNGSTT